MARHRLATALRAAALGCTLLALLAMIAWASGRMVSDRYLWSQFLAWIPTALGIAVAGVLLGIATVLGFLSRRLAPRARRPRLLLTAVLLLAAQSAFFVLVECRIYRLAAREELHAAAERQGGLRILFWNASSKSGSDFRTTMNLVGSDLAIIANPTWERPFFEMAEAYGPSWYINADPFIILSRNPVLRWGGTTLGLHGQQQISFGPGELEILPRGGRDTGHAMWLELDTRQALGRTAVVWILDLPSDQRTGRWENARRAAAVMRDWAGPAKVPDGRGGVLRSEPAAGFPAPDVVIGDLNAPRGSASLSLLAPGMHEAYAEGGAGYAATFPRRHPLVHIDLVLAAAWLRSADYRIIDPGHGTHRMQWARLEVR